MKYPRPLAPIVDDFRGKSSFQLNKKDGATLPLVHAAVTVAAGISLTQSTFHVSTS